MSKVGESSLQAGFPIRGWFAESPADFRRDFLALAMPKSYAAGSVIFQAGEVGQDVFGVYSGVVTLQSRLTHPDAVLLHMVWPGEWFGTWSMLLGKGRRMSAVARTEWTCCGFPAMTCGHCFDVAHSGMPNWRAMRSTARMSPCRSLPTC